VNSNKVYITSAGIITGTKSEANQINYKIASEQYEPMLEHFQTRNVDRMSKLSLAAATVTLANRGVIIEKGSINDYGIILGTQFSALESIHNYDMEALEKGALAVNPGLFPNTVLNSPSCQVSIQFSFAGPVYTVCNGLTSSLDSIGIGYNLGKTNLSSMVLAGGVDEITELQTMMKNSDKALGEAAGFVMLESEKTITENEKIAEIIGYKSRSLNQEWRLSLGELVSGLILDAITSRGNDIDNITNISLCSAFSCRENEVFLSDIIKEMNYSGAAECLEVNWMGACGIVQVDEALKGIKKENRENTIWALVNVDKDKAVVVVLKAYK